jgi:hypothetical protein
VGENSKLIVVAHENSYIGIVSALIKGNTLFTPGVKKLAV